MRKLFLLLIALGASCALALGQARTVRGTVTSADDGGPLPQLTVLIKGTTTGVVTNLDGQYALTVPGPAAVLVFKYTGYETQEIPVGDRATIDVVMKPALEEIDQVVVMGYGSAKKISSSVGNVATVGESDLKEKPTANPLEALSGKVAGMSVLTGSGEPSATASIRLHGNASLTAGSAPLYIVDGIATSASRVLEMNPSDFANVSVLTDASATSIYGARAANGVIYITTKQGRSGEEGKVTVRAMFGLSNLANTDYFEQLMTSRELFDFGKEIGKYSPQEQEDLQKKYDLNKTTKWYDFYFASDVPTYSGDVSFSGGGQQSTYYLSGGYFNQKGLRPYSGFERYTLRTNVNTRLKRWLKVGMNSNLGYSMRRLNSSGRTSAEAIGFYNLPWISTKDKDGKEYPDIIPGTINNLYNPAYLDKMVNSTGKKFTLTSMGFIEVEPIANLKVRSQASIDAFYSMNQNKDLPSAVWNKKKPTDITGNGFASGSVTRDVMISFTNTAEYTFTIMEDHHLTPLVGHEYTENNRLYMSASGSGLTNDNLMDLTAATESKKISESTTGYFFNSFFGRLEYDYKSKYFLSASLRDDQSSRFGKDRQHGLFWSVGLMWNAKREEFLRRVPWVTALRVKTSVGTSGNSDISNFAAIAKVALARQYNAQNSYTLTNPGNPQLTWERQLKFTVGTDLTLWGMWNMDLSFYYRRTSSMLMDIPIPLELGFSTLSGNVGTLSNMGVDIKSSVVAWSNEKGDHVTPYVTFNYNRERVEELFNGKKFWPFYSQGQAFVVGLPVQLSYPLFYRVNPENGNPEWYLPNPDKPEEIQKDKTKITNVFNSEGLTQVTGKPRYAPINGGFGLSASYWGFYLQADFVFTLGKWLISNDAFFLENPLMPFANQSRKLKGNYWTPERRNAKYPGKHVLTWSQFDDRIISNASFMRMKTLTVGYIVPKKWIAKTQFFTSAKVYASLRNYLTVTNFNGVDPELDSNLALGQYPNTKQWSVGIELEF